MSDLRTLNASEWPGPSAGSGPYRHLYIIQEDDAGPIKIGIASNASCRRVELQAGNIRPLKLVAVFIGLDKSRVGKIEREIHHHFSGKRIVNEWFDVTPAIALDFIVGGYC